MRVLLISTYEMGRQPFALASARAWLEKAGHRTKCRDLAVEKLETPDILAAELVAIHLPMHTATRLALPVIERVKLTNSAAKLCAFGLYAPLNADLLRELGVTTILGGEFEADLVKAAAGIEPQSDTGIEKLRFLVPDRRGLPPLERYAKVHGTDEPRFVAYTEATRGCKHTCRHCPVVPVYNGQFRVVDRDVVMEDIRRQVNAGAGHVTFGDPDFFNGPGHAARIVETLAREFPGVTYDVTIKIEHLLKHRGLLPVLSKTGCLWVTSAVESLDNEVLGKLAKGHTRRDFFEAIARCRETGLTLAPTFIAFTPWTTRESYRDLLRVIRDLDLIAAVSPIQLALRLLITESSRLLELDEIRALISGYDRKSLVYRWKHPDEEVDELAASAFHVVAEGQKQGRAREEIFARLWALAKMRENLDLLPRAAVPYLDEPWYC